MERGPVDYWRRLGITQSEHFFQYLNAGFSMSIYNFSKLKLVIPKVLRENFQLDLQLQKYGEGVQYACSARQSQITYPGSYSQLILKRATHLLLQHLIALCI